MDKQATDQVTDKSTGKKCNISYDMMNFASNPSLDEIQEVCKRIQKIVEFAFKHLTGNESLSDMQIEFYVKNTTVPITEDEQEIRKFLGIENNPSVDLWTSRDAITVSDRTFWTEENQEE